MPVIKFKTHRELSFATSADGKRRISSLDGAPAQVSAAELAWMKDPKNSMSPAFLKNVASGTIEIG